MNRTLRLACLALLVAMEGVACGGGSQAPSGPPHIDPKVASLEIVVVSPSLLVHEMALLTVKARNADGAVVPTPPQLHWTSSDQAIASVEASDAGSGVVTPLRRGTVTINVRTGSIDASASLSVKARVVIGRPPFGQFASVDIATGDDLQFVALFVDVNGATIDETPSVTWASVNPQVAGVSSTGRVTGLGRGVSTITARNSDGVGTMEVRVSDVVAGFSAKVRLAHVAGGVGPLTFVPSQGVPVTLSFGESAEVPIVSGTFRVHVDGLQSVEPWPPLTSEGSWLVRAGDHLVVFGTSNAGLTGWWIDEATVPADSGLIRLVQGTGPPNFAGVVLLGAPGATAVESRLIHCYFDPSEFTDYMSLPAGEFEVLMGDKGLFFHLSDDTAVRARGRITVTPGRATTYVITGESPETMRLLAFPDF